MWGADAEGRQLLCVPVLWDHERLFVARPPRGQYGLAFPRPEELGVTKDEHGPVGAH
jgi:hypothetical protein